MPVVKYMYMYMLFRTLSWARADRTTSSSRSSGLVDMFTACTKADEKEKILLNYANPGSVLQIVITTIT